MECLTLRRFNCVSRLLIFSFVYCFNIRPFIIITLLCLLMRREIYFRTSLTLIEKDQECSRLGKDISKLKGDLSAKDADIKSETANFVWFFHFV